MNTLTSSPQANQSITRTFKIRRTLKAKQNIESQQQEYVQNLEDLRLAENTSANDNAQDQQKKDNKLRQKNYQGDEQNLNCYRFPHASFCGCASNCLLESFDLVQVLPGLYYGDFVSGLKTKYLLQSGITHILNVTSKEYTKRGKYFEYLNIDLHDNSEEDAKKFFRISNRFIRNTLLEGGKVFIHSSVMQIGAVMAIGYLIGICKIPLKLALKKATNIDLQITPHFMKQLEVYDLQKMAFVSIQRQ